MIAAPLTSPPFRLRTLYPCLVSPASKEISGAGRHVRGGRTGIVRIRTLGVTSRAFQDRAMIFLPLMHWKKPVWHRYCLIYISNAVYIFPDVIEEMGS